jgi:hypothetical protein
MSIFQNIDFKLLNLSEKLGAKLSKDRPDSPRILVDFEERRIDWTDNNINKAIIIQPSFENGGVNSEVWFFINIAWFNYENPWSRPMWKVYLVEKEKFEIIEKNIDMLLEESLENLMKLTLKDLTESRI